MLGAPLVASGCRNAAPPLPPGELVGAADQFGHRLRAGVVPRVLDDRWRRCRVVIIGAGVAGLSAARRLSKAGMNDFVLLELEQAPGGTSRSGRNAVTSFPWGAHYVPAPTRENTALVELFNEMGLFEGLDEMGNPVVAEQFRVRYPEERVFYRGAWYEGLYLEAGASHEDRRQLAAFQREIQQWTNWRDGKGRRAFATPMASASDDAEVTQLDGMSMADWLDERGLTSPRLRWLIDYSCRDDYGLRAHQTSAWAGLFYFAARRSETSGESQPYITWPEGNGRIVRHLASSIQSQLQRGWMAFDVTPQSIDDARQIDITAVSPTGDVQGLRADCVIFAAPQFLAPHVMRSFRSRPPAHGADFQYGAWAVVNLTLLRNPESRGASLAWDNVLYESPSLGYVSATHQRGLDHGPAVWTYYYPLTEDDPRESRQRLLSLDREDWAEVALADVERAHPRFREFVQRADVMRWGHAMVLPRPGFMWGQSRKNASSSENGVFFAHSDLSGLPLFEEAFDRGIRAAEGVLAQLGIRSPSIL
jgi:phytoene dehydrogenase-like protein